MQYGHQQPQTVVVHEEKKSDGCIKTWYVHMFKGPIADSWMINAPFNPTRFLYIAKEIR